jgi:type III pantothenate kinase
MTNGPPNLIAVDVGNSALKLGLFSTISSDSIPRPLSVLRIDVADELDRTELFLPPEPVLWSVVSVNRSSEADLRRWVRRERGKDEYHLLTYDILPLQLAVRFPDRVGVDRLVSSVAVNRRRPVHEPAIIVDAGTAVTVDVVDGSGVFQGGAILPGLRTAARSLAVSTDALPTTDPLDDDHQPVVIGKSTEEAIRSGVIWGVVGAVKELVARMRQELDCRAPVFCTGGQGRFLSRLLGTGVQFIPHLVLEGAAIAARSLER